MDAKMDKKQVDDVVLVGRSTQITKVLKLLQKLFNRKKLSKRIHVDEAVAHGAAKLSEDELGQKVKDLVLLDVVPLSLGVATYDGTTSVIIPRNTPIPAKKDHIYTTAKDNQTHIMVNVYQGERVIAKENKWLGRLIIGVPLAPKGESKIKVVFDIEANGILKCSVEELTTGLKKKIVISGDNQRLSKEHIEKILKDAQKHKYEDEEYKIMVVARKDLEVYIDKVKSKIKTHREDLMKIDIAIKDASHLLERSKIFNVGTYKDTLEQPEEICDPIIAKLV
ncbi:heat shock 70 kDa protein-like [Rutidosis leptorrhynchoides]|uniref:heat shock 70 kDa protein-like n=1 Tax=Rutidosis leptorrhynchoides TaxID=125765 RepID=UPI003A99223D